MLFQNKHDGTFRDISQQVGPAIQTPQVSRGLAAGDLFNDGHMELVIENLEGSPMILRPEGASQNAWISLTLQGTKSNRLALNARIRVTAGDLVQTDKSAAAAAISLKMICACTLVWAVSITSIRLRSSGLPVRTIPIRS